MRLVRKLLEAEQKTPKEKEERKSYLIDLERRLQSLLGTKVKIEQNKRGQRGRIVIDFYSLDEFQRLTETIGLKADDIF